MNIRGITTLIRKELIRIKDVWKQSLLAPVISNLLFFVVFGVAFSGRVASFEGFEYLTILVPGLVAMGLMMNALQNPIFSIVISKYTNNIGDLLVLPLSGIELAIAYIFGGLARGFAIGIVTLIVGMFFTTVPFAHPFIILVFATLMGGAFASFGSMIGIWAKEFDQANFIPTFVINPLIYLGGVFYSVSELPAYFQTISRFNPIFYMVDGFRYGFIGVGDANIWLSLTITSIIFLFFFLSTAWMFHTGYKIKT